MKHNLHGVIGKIINRNENNFGNCRIIYDLACNIPNKAGKQNIPLFCSKDKSNKTEYCNVDILIIKDEKIKVIIEIDESNLKPTHIFGKFLASALSSYYIHQNDKNVPIAMDNDVSFIQILDTSNLKKESSKTIQWENIEKSIKKIIPLKNSKIKNYYLITEDTSNSKLLEKKLINQILINL